MTKRNMKIEINEIQPLDEVEVELERLGFNFNCGCGASEAKMIVARCGYSQYDIYSYCDSIYKDFVTLAELKEMK